VQLDQGRAVAISVTVGTAVVNHLGLTDGPLQLALAHRAGQQRRQVEPHQLTSQVVLRDARQRRRGQHERPSDHELRVVREHAVVEGVRPHPGQRFHISSRGEAETQSETRKAVRAPRTRRVGAVERVPWPNVYRADRATAVHMASSTRDGRPDHEDEIRMWREDDTWVITDVETGVTTQGETREEALEMLDEAVALYRGEAGESIDTPEDEREVLEELGIDPDEVEAAREENTELPDFMQ